MASPARRLQRHSWQDIPLLVKIKQYFIIQPDQPDPETPSNRQGDSSGTIDKISNFWNIFCFKTFYNSGLGTRSRAVYWILFSWRDHESREVDAKLIAQPDDHCYWYLDFCVDHLFFPSQIQRNIVVCYASGCRAKAEKKTKEEEDQLIKTSTDLEKILHLMWSICIARVVVTVCVKVPLTHYLVGKQSHLDLPLKYSVRPRGI